MIEHGERRLIIDLNDLRAADKDAGNRILHHPLEFIGPFQSALKAFVQQMAADVLVGGKEIQTANEYFVGLQGTFGSQRVTPRQLRSQYLSSMVCVEGIITRCMLVCVLSVCVRVCVVTVTDTDCPIVWLISSHLLSSSPPLPSSSPPSSPSPTHHH
jgi:DNA replication licensing factor MCM3